MTQLSQPITYLCERCGRAMGPEILTCPDRTQGHCPYVKKNLVPLRSRLVGVYFLLFGILLSLSAKEEGFTYGFDVFATLIGLILVGIGFFRTFHTSILLYNPILRLIWKKKALLGIALERTLIRDGKPLHLGFSVSQSLRFPPSVTKLSEIATEKKQVLTQATDLFRIALFGLWVREVIQICQYQKYVARGWGEFKRGQDPYVFTATEKADSASTDGALEQKILLVLKSWATRKEEEALEWPDGPLIYELIRAVYDEDISSPENWVFELVGQDAVASGWGRLEGWPRKRYKPSAIYEERFQTERAFVNEWFSRFALQHPDLSQVLADQIYWAILSRYPKRTNDYT